MSPLYDYFCQGCGKSFEKLQSYEGRDLVSCPDCGDRVDREVSNFNWKWFNRFTKDGEGFSTVSYHPDEYRERIRANAGKYD